MGYLIENTNNFPVLKLTVTIAEANFQTLHTKPVLIYSATGTSTFVPVLAYLDSTGASYAYNKLYFQDSFTSPTLTYGVLDVQQLNAGAITGGIWTFNTFVNANGILGTRNVSNRDTYLKAQNNDDLSGTGDMILTIYYLDVKK